MNELKTTSNATETSIEIKLYLNQSGLPFFNREEYLAWVVTWKAEVNGLIAQVKHEKKMRRTPFTKLMPSRADFKTGEKITPEEEQVYYAAFRQYWKEADVFTGANTRRQAHRKTLRDLYTVRATSKFESQRQYLEARGLVSTDRSVTSAELQELYVS